MEEVIVVFFKREDREVVVSYLTEYNIGFFFNYLMFFLLEACTDYIQNHFPSCSQMQRVIDHEVTEAAYHQLLHLEDLCLQKDFFKRFEVITLERKKIFAVEELSDQLFEEIRCKNGNLLGLVLAQL